MNNIEGKKLLILGGIPLSREIIKRAKNMGVKVYVTDYIEKSPSKKYADKSFMVSTTDVDAVANLVKEEEVDGILTGFIDLLLPYYQQICEKTNKPCYSTKEQIELLTDKVKFKELCRSFEVPVVEDYDIKKPFDKDILTNLKYPILLKPVDNSGGKGIFICSTPDELITNYEKSLSFSPSKQVLVERYMADAKEATIFYIVQDGKILLTAMGTRHIKHFQDGIIPLPVAYSFPSNYLEEYQRTLHKKVVDMFTSIGIKNGMIFIQSFIENKECIFYEVGYRLTGSLEYKIISHACGINPMDMMIRYAITGKMYNGDIEKFTNPKFQNFYCNITLLSRPGKIKKITGIEEVKTTTNVLDVVTSYEEEGIIPETATGTLAQVIVRVFAFAKTKEELATMMNIVQNTIKVTSPDGKNMLLPVFDTNELFDC